VDVSLLEAIGLQVGLSLRARQLERRASQTEKLISLGTLAAGLAHELRNPLVSIQTFSSLMKERGMDVDFQQEFGAVVQRDVNRIASIVENVSAFAESNKVDMMAVDLSEVLRTVAEIVRPELVRTGIPLDLPDRSVPLIRGNHSQLLQVFLNLIQNALQALEGRTGARLTLGYETHLNDLAIPLVCVTVEDNGPGIDSALQPHIFDPFTTTKATGERRGKHGMGLGLAIVKRIVQYHRGEINVSSTPGRGTVFRVYLPQFS
jgi:two-component system nitrogen regulation sensor histidine kinase GlnL